MRAFLIDILCQEMCDLTPNFLQEILDLIWFKMRHFIVKQFSNFRKK